MKYILFDKNAIEYLASKQEYQSLEYREGRYFVDFILKNGADDISFFKGGIIHKESDGLMFIGKRPELSDEKKILVIDLLFCDLIKIEENSPENILLVMQKMFRSSIHIWQRQPFTNSEQTNGSKLILFPFPYNYNKKGNKRLVFEREIKNTRLLKRGIKFPLLVYKYNDEEVPYGTVELPDDRVLEKAGEAYIKVWPTLTMDLANKKNVEVATEHQIENLDFYKQFSDGGFKYLTYAQQYNKLTEKQKAVVDFSGDNQPIRIAGPAGTGKTASMILRAYRLLTEAKNRGNDYQIIFITHSESTKYETESNFARLEGSNEFLSDGSLQHIEFITLLSFCKRHRGIHEIQTIDADAADAKEYQLMLIDEAYRKIKSEQYKANSKFLSPELKSALETNADNIIALFLQHEFSIQIRGKANGMIEKYKEVPSLKHAFPISDDGNYKDKEFLFEIYLQYEKYLRAQASYDTDDIAIETLMSLNAPIWRRQRAENGYDYVFIDELHQFNWNEQQIFHFLTREYSKTPMCFALDYSQAIGDRGDVESSYAEKILFFNAERFDYQAVFRNSKDICNLCASLLASGGLIFDADFKNPYDNSPSVSTVQDERLFSKPKLCMYKDEEDMVLGLKQHVDRLSKELQCKNYHIAVISFDNKYFEPGKIRELGETIGRSIYYLQGRNVGGLNQQAKEGNSIILTSPHNVNGLEFNAVLLLGVDGVRVPQTVGVADVSRNWLKYSAFNMLYLSCSRARYQLVILGNRQNEISECLEHSIEVGTLETCVDDTKDLSSTKQTQTTHPYNYC